MAEKKELRILLGTASLVGFTAMSGPVMAQSTSNDTLTVQATVGSECTVDGGTLDFGSYTGTSLNGEAEIAYDCNVPSDISISLSAGTSTAEDARFMVNQDDSVTTMDYQLYRNTERNEIWGSAPLRSRNLSGVTEGTETVFGNIPGDQDNVVAGTYSDIITITLTSN